MLAILQQLAIVQREMVQANRVRVLWYRKYWQRDKRIFQLDPMLLHPHRNLRKHGKWNRTKHCHPLTQLDLAAECGMEESNIGRIENGNTNPTAKTLLKIAKALGVSFSELVRYK